MAEARGHDSEMVRMYMVHGSYIVADDREQAIGYYNRHEVGRGPRATEEDVVPVIQQDLDDWEEEWEGSFNERLDRMGADFDKPFLYSRNEQRWDLMPAMAGPDPFESQN